MSRRDATEAALAAVAAWPAEPALSSRSGHVVAAGVRALESRELDGYADAVEAALQSRLGEGAVADPGATAMTACVHALVRWGEGSVEVFEACRWRVQREPVWGGTVDVAGAVRGAGIEGLALWRAPAAWAAVADGLSDPEPQARLGAVAGCERLGGLEGAALLRMHVRRGDDHDGVLEAALAAMFALDPSSAGLAKAWLDSGLDGRSDLVALALGAARTDEAWAVLDAAAAGALPSEAVFTGLLVHRTEAALGSLRDALARGGDAGRAARRAAAPFAEVSGVRELLEAAPGPS